MGTPSPLRPAIASLYLPTPAPQLEEAVETAESRPPSIAAPRMAQREGALAHEPIRLDPHGRDPRAEHEEPPVAAATLPRPRDPEQPPAPEADVRPDATWGDEQPGDRHAERVRHERPHTVQEAPVRASTPRPVAADGSIAARGGHETHRLIQLPIAPQHPPIARQPPPQQEAVEVSREPAREAMSQPTRQPPHDAVRHADAPPPAVLTRLGAIRDSVITAAKERRDSSPVVRVTIGRIDVRSTPAAPAAPARAPQRAQEPRMALADYLRKKRRGDAS
jgi:hypothetical protein